MNRRDLLRRAFAVSAAGLMLPVVEPVRKAWALDRTMIPFVSFGGRGDRVTYMVYDEASFALPWDEDWILLPNRPESILRMYNFSTD